MLVRLDWTITARPLSGEGALLPPVKVEFKEGNMAENQCDLMWEGPIKEKSFIRFMPKTPRASGRLGTCWEKRTKGIGM